MDKKTLRIMEFDPLVYKYRYIYFNLLALSRNDDKDKEKRAMKEDTLDKYNKDITGLEFVVIVFEMCISLNIMAASCSMTLIITNAINPEMKILAKLYIHGFNNFLLLNSSAVNAVMSSLRLRTFLVRKYFSTRLIWVTVRSVSRNNLSAMSFTLMWIAADYGRETAKRPCLLGKGSRATDLFAGN
jgi:hypothetical protein